MLARQATGIDNISGGRLQLGMGAGYAPTDFEMVGLQPWLPDERAERFREAVELVDRLLRGETVDYKGKHYQVPKMRIRPRPVHIPRPPLCIAAHARESLKLVARYGDIWSSFGGWGLSSPELMAVTKARAEALDEFCAELGRDPASVRRQILAGNPATTPDPIWSSVDAFDTWLAGWEEIGIDEIVLYFPPEVLYEPEMIDPEVLDHIQGLLFAKRAA
jgi:alkanesulfonate monooxygenase SsuD/methylene tetrahydromethanopterin reductase-like flavin-dependent oxidoreductase (luciferase family)